MASFNWPQGSPFWSARKYGWKDFGGNVQMDFNTEDQPERKYSREVGWEWRLYLRIRKEPRLLTRSKT